MTALCRLSAGWSPLSGESGEPGMGLFSRKPLVCPVCLQEVVVGPTDRNGFGHFGTHLNDIQGPGSPLRLPLRFVGFR